jgi:hypothetical protein
MSARGLAAESDFFLPMMAFIAGRNARAKCGVDATRSTRHPLAVTSSFAVLKVKNRI